MSNNSNILPESVDNSLKNLTDPVTKQIGTTFSDIWYIVIGSRTSLAAQKRALKVNHDLEAYKNELDHEVANIPPEKYVEPSLSVTAQALENSKYQIEEPELRAMFTSLISKSMNSDYVDKVHPSFAEILKQMSPLDAQTISLFKKNPKDGLPICCYRLEDHNVYKDLARDILLENVTSNSFQQATSLSSLSRLGLITIDYTKWFVEENDYDGFNKTPLLKGFQSQHPDQKITIQKGIAKLTLLGIRFVDVCVPN